MLGGNLGSRLYGDVSVMSSSLLIGDIIVKKKIFKETAVSQIDNGL